jgi:oligosaccharide:H+ symporter
MNKLAENKISIDLFMINAFIYISFSLFSPFLSSYYTKAGISAVQIGILLTIGPVAAIMIQPLWAFLSDKTGRRKDVLSIIVLGSAISMFSYYLGNSFFTFFIATLLLSIFNTSIIPLSDAIILRITHKHQLDFSKIRRGGTIGYAIMVIIAGAIIKQNPPLQFTMGFIGYLILFIFVQKLPKDEKEEKVILFETAISKPNKRDWFKFLKIFESKQVVFVLLFAFVSQVGLSFNYSFLGVYMVNIGLGEGTIGIINSVAAFSELPILFLINRILNKISTMKLIIISSLFVALRIFTVTGGTVGFFVLSQMLHGASFMTIYYSCAVFISKYVKPENQSQGQSTLAIIQTGIGSIVGNIVGGTLVDHFGLKSAYQTMTVIIVAVSGIIAFIQFLFLRKESANSRIPV